MDTTGMDTIWIQWNAFEILCKGSNKKESVHTMMELEELCLVDKEQEENEQEQMIEEEIDD